LFWLRKIGTDRRSVADFHVWPDDRTLRRVGFPTTVAPILQNGFVESSHSRFRDECLNWEQLWTLTEARVVIEDYRREYNQRRPHSKLGYQSPAWFAAQLGPSPAPVGLRPPSAGDGQNQTINQHEPSPQTNSLGGSKR